MKPAIAWKPLANSRQVASARLRSFLPCEYLNEGGWRREIFNPDHASTYDLVIFQKTYSEEDINLARSLKSRGAKTVFDLCDNHFYNPGNSPEFKERAERLQRMIDVVDAVSVSTLEVGRLISGKPTVVIDDAVDQLQRNLLLESSFRLRSRLRRLTDRSFRVVWYGNAGLESPPFGLVDVPKVMPFLEELHARVPLTLTVISNSEALFGKFVRDASFAVKYYDWDMSTFPYLFKQHDVCIIPVNINPFTVCKTSNRLVLSLLLGVPVVADRIPSYEEFGDFVLFSDWQHSLHAYATDPALRREHVRRGAEYIRSTYTSDRVVSQWSSLFRMLLN